MVTSNQFALFIISINWAGRVISLNMRLITENLSCVRGGRAIFSDLSFEVGAGECLLLLGANGAGKTSLHAANSMSGFYGKPARRIRRMFEITPFFASLG